MRKISLAHVFMLMILALAVAAGCTKEGPAGPAGVDGTDGTDGVDGNASCIQCHTIEYMNQVEAQYAMSGHAAGLMVDYAGGRNNCAMCHSDEGFRETQHTGMDTTATDIALPTHIQCSTCHDFHQTLDFENDGPDYAIRANGPVDLLMYRGSEPVVVLDYGNNSNLCVNCHQPRRADPEDDGTGNYTITSTFYGPHYGTQGTLFQGIGGAEIGVGYPEPGSSTHTQVACTDCHMHEYADGEGGHTGKVPLAACTSCHEGATDFNINGKQTEVEDLMQQLKDKMVALGVYDEQGHPVPGTYPLTQVQAVYNYETIFADGSLGVHNPAYIKQLLTNSINALD